MEKGAPPRKLVMGMPLYGQSFTLADTKNHGLNSRAPGPGQAGEATRAAGFLAYYEVSGEQCVPQSQSNVRFEILDL